MRRLLAALCVLAAGAGLAMGSGGFDSVDADRGVTVETVGDENAYMSLTYSEQRETVTDGETVELVTVANQFSESVTFEITNVATVGDIDATLESQPGDVGVGDEETVMVTVVSDSCDDDSSPSSVDGTVVFDVTADGDGVFAETTEQRPVDYEVTC
jgi:hypothetical protein